MLRNYCLATVVVVALTSCGSKNTDKGSTVQDTTSTSDLSGEYATTDNTGSLTVTNWSGSGFEFELTVVTEDAGCTGELTGMSAFDPVNSQWIYEDKEFGCLVKFTWSGSAFDVSEEGACDHGAACSFAGTYKRSLSGQTAASDNAATATRTMNSLMDYYLALPAEYLTCEIPGPYGEQERQAAIRSQNDAQTQMVVTTEELENMQLAMFEGGDGEKYVAIVYECGAGCQCTKRHLLTFDGSEWSDNYKALVPDIDSLAAGDENIAVRIAPAGTIEVYDAGDTARLLATLTWDGTRFNMHP